MIKLSIHKAKTHLSQYLSKLASGEKIIICKRNIPIAELVPIVQLERKANRPISLAKGQFTVPEDFFKPLPADTIISFYSEKP